MSLRVRCWKCRELLYDPYAHEHYLEMCSDNHGRCPGCGTVFFLPIIMDIGAERQMKIEIGTLVDYHAEIGGPITKANCAVRSAPWQSVGGKWVVLICGVTGGVSLDALSLSESGEAV